jgi:gamma-glutamyltranspeptidase/glutathione hydrolase
MHLGRYPPLVVPVGIAALVLSTACAPVEVRYAVKGPQTLRTRETRSDLGMISSGSMEATRAGVRILEQGGNAVDAAAAVALALGSADPGASGLGGMTYVLIHLADGRSVAIDGSATVPLAVDPEKLLEMEEAGRLYGHGTAAVPTTLATLAHALERYGTLDLAGVLEPAIEIADRGYLLNPNQITWIDNYLDPILASAYLRFLVLDDGLRIGRPGDRYCNHDLAETLRRIATAGVGSFYRGRIAERIEHDMKRHGGFVSRSDLALVRIRETRPVRTTYRDVRILSFPSPGAGGAVIEALNILKTFPSDFFADDSAERLQVMVDAFRIARTDHLLLTPDPNRYTDSVDLAHLSDTHGRERAALITPGRALQLEEPENASAFRRPGDHTTHVSVVDRYGNVVSLTQTLGRQYGAKVATPGLGFPYNCLLEFSEFGNPGSPGYPRPRARPLTDMAPTIVLRDGVFLIALGSAGSERVPPIITQVISSVVDRGMGLRDAVLAPRVMWGGDEELKAYLEITGPLTETHADTLERFGFEDVYRLRFPPRLIDLTFFGGVNAVAFESSSGTFVGVGDPRRYGFAEGPQACVAPTASFGDAILNIATPRTAVTHGTTREPP